MQSENSLNRPDNTRPQVGRRAVINRDDLLQAAIRLIGPHRSVSTLGLREIARQAGIAPNSFYRHFRDVDELAVALVEEAGTALRRIIGQARQRASPDRSIVRSSVEIFMEQLHADGQYLPFLLREGNAGSPAFKAAVERQLQYFEDELQRDLERLSAQKKSPLISASAVARAITRLVFDMGKRALDLPRDQHPALIEDMVLIIRMLLVGAEVMASPDHPRRL